MLYPSGSASVAMELMPVYSSLEPVTSGPKILLHFSLFLSANSRQMSLRVVEMIFSKSSFVKKLIFAAAV